MLAKSLNEGEHEKAERYREINTERGRERREGEREGKERRMI